MLMSVDIETYSPVNLQKCGVYKYAEDPEFEILLFGYAYEDAPVRVIDLKRGEQLPADVINALYHQLVIKTAYNAAFERTCLNAYLTKRGYDKLDIRQWECTAVMAAELGLPKRLADVGKVLSLLEDKQKLKIGKSLVSYFCIPGKTGRHLPEDDLRRWELFKDYNRVDVESEREIRIKLSRFKVSPLEKLLWFMDQSINDRGVMADIDFVKNAVEMDGVLKSCLLTTAKDLTGLDNPNSAAQVKDWIEDKSGVAVESLRKDKINEVKAAVNNEEVDAMLDIRAGLSKTSTEKYNAILRTACNDNRIRGLTQFYGANRTGRWAGRLVQMQNLPQSKISDLDLARQLVAENDLESTELLYDNSADILSQLIRTAFIPKPGYKFVVADFSAIEARIIAWLSGENWRLKVFETHGKIYEASAERMFNLPSGSVTKDDPIRQKGKIAELALGYGGSEGALINMGALNMGLTQPELKPLVYAWRSANPAIVRFWYDLDRAARRTISTGSTIKLQFGIEFYKDGPLLRLKLPNGRSLSYVKPAIKNDQITYEGIIQTSGGWGRIETYGAKLVENITQAIARDCLATVMYKLEASVVFHVHDELICEVQEGKADETLKYILQVMSEPLEWAQGLPLKADGFICDYYRK